MRINKFVAAATGVSRRQADVLVAEGKVTVDGKPAQSGQDVVEGQSVKLGGRSLLAAQRQTTILMNKPTGYVCSRNGQGSRTIYDILPVELHNLKTIGRLDKESSGLILLTSDGQLAFELTHPKFAKQKIYNIRLNKELEPLHQQMISDIGITLEDGPSRLMLSRLSEDNRLDWQVTMSEGRNRQIRRTFESLGYRIKNLHRIQFGQYTIDDIPLGKYRTADIS